MGPVLENRLFQIFLCHLYAKLTHQVRKNDNLIISRWADFSKLMEMAISSFKHHQNGKLEHVNGSKCCDSVKQ